MPHIEKFELNGQRIPSVNDVTSALSQEGLIRNFYRPNGFKKADKISKAARNQGIKLATVFERYRQTGRTGKTSQYNTTCVSHWTDWYNSKSYEIVDDKWVEPHLVNTVVGYHGSADVIMHEPLVDGDSAARIVLGDDKSKKRFADYKLIMNEHAYAMCDSYEDPVTKEIKKLPWEPPISGFWFWTYDPQSGELYPVYHAFEQGPWLDFLRCKDMLEVNKRAEAYFKQFAVLLPTQEGSYDNTNSAEKTGSGSRSGHVDTAASGSNSQGS